LLEWETPQTFREVRLVFDTGLHRELTLTLCNAVARRLNWGIPQPEAIKDYRVEILTATGWTSVIQEKNNFLRHRIHRLEEAVTVSALRLVCESTNGAPTARVCEIRVYG
jgi:hypothetical protein